MDTNNNDKKEKNSKKNPQLALPPQWTRIMSDRGPYYWNKETNFTQWKFPMDEAYEFHGLQKDHGYMNVNRRQKPTSVNKINRTRLSQKKPRTLETVPRSHTMATRIKDSMPTVEHAKSTIKHVDTVEATPNTPPPLSPRTHDTEDDSYLDSLSPPPIPARNYGNDDVVGLEESSVPLSPDDSPPPPIPIKTELSEQLLSPPHPLREHFIYNSHLSDLNFCGNDRDQSNQRPPVDPPTTSNIGNGNIAASNQPLVYDEINQRPRVDDHPTSNRRPPVDLPTSNQRPPVDLPTTSNIGNGNVASNQPLVYDEINQRPRVDHPTSNQRPPVDLPTSNQRPPVDLPTSNQRPPVDLPTTSNIGNGNIAASNQTLVYDEINQSRIQRPPVDPPTSNKRPSVDPPTSNQRPPVDPPTSNQRPPVDPPTSNQRPPVDLPTSNQRPPVDLPTSNQRPPVDLPTSNQRPPVDLPTSNQRPPVDLPTSNQRPPVDLPTISNIGNGNVALNQSSFYDEINQNGFRGIGTSVSNESRRSNRSRPEPYDHTSTRMVDQRESSDNNKPLLYAEVFDPSFRGLSAGTRMSRQAGVDENLTAIPRDKDMLYDEVFDPNKPRNVPTSNHTCTTAVTTADGTYNRLDFTPSARPQNPIVNTERDSEQLLYDQVAEPCLRGVGVVSRTSNTKPQVAEPCLRGVGVVSRTSNTKPSQISIGAIYDEVSKEERTSQRQPPESKPCDATANTTTNIVASAFYEDPDKMSPKMSRDKKVIKQHSTDTALLGYTKPDRTTIKQHSTDSYHKQPEPERRTTPISNRRVHVANSCNTNPPPSQSPPPPPKDRRTNLPPSQSPPPPPKDRRTNLPPSPSPPPPPKDRRTNLPPSQSPPPPPKDRRTNSPPSPSPPQPPPKDRRTNFPLSQTLPPPPKDRRTNLPPSQSPPPPPKDRRTNSPPSPSPPQPPPKDRRTNFPLSQTLPPPPKDRRTNPPPSHSPPPPPKDIQVCNSPPSPGSRPPIAIPSTKTPPPSSKTPPSKKRSTIPRSSKSHPPPIVTPPPTPIPSSVSKDHLRDTSPIPSSVLAYEVVPILSKCHTTTTTMDSNNEEIFMTVNHEKQFSRLKKFGGSLRTSYTPPVPSRRRNKEATHHSSNPSLDIENHDRYDRLNRDHSMNSTLPCTHTATAVDSTYSSLKLKDQKMRQLKQGIEIHGSLMMNSYTDVSNASSDVPMIHAPNVPSSGRQRKQHMYDDCGDNEFLKPSKKLIITRRHSNPAIGNNILPQYTIPQLVYAPNPPSSNLKRRPHLYEDFGNENEDHSSNDNDSASSSKNGSRSSLAATVRPKSNLYDDVHNDTDDLKDTPTPNLYDVVHNDTDDMKDTPLVWDDDLLAPVNKSRGFAVGKLSTDFRKPSSVSDEDYQKRLERLDNHEYKAIDIPMWPDQKPVIATLKQPPDIKKVVRDSWLSKEASDHDLPAGWKKELNEQGQEFYWHIPSGNIQYVKPIAGLRNLKSQSPGDDLRSPTPISTTFAAEYWGSCHVPEEKLIKGKSVKVVLACMRDILDREDETEIHFIGGLKKSSTIHLEVTDSELRWVNAKNNSPIAAQPINRMRVWAVGKEDEREFGYIAKNLSTMKYVCHVLKCDITAMGVTQAMMNSHHYMVERRKLSETDDGLSAGDIGNNDLGNGGGGTVLVQVPLTAATRERSITNLDEKARLEDDEPASEYYSRVECTYIGYTDAMGPKGVDVVNEAMAQLSIAKSRWLPVYVDVANTHVRILDQKTETVIKEHRIRFLTFLGLASDERYCGYVVDNGDNNFLMHGFICEPCAEKLCLAILHACQARYQRVLDCHLSEGDVGNIDSYTLKRKRSLLSRIGTWKSKPKEIEEDISAPGQRSFIVQFLGCEPVPKKTTHNIDSLIEPLAIASTKTSGIHLVELIVLNNGFVINDPQKKQFASKQFIGKKLLFCAKVRSHFAFVGREGNKHVCYMFGESEVDMGTITRIANQAK